MAKRCFSVFGNFVHLYFRNGVHLNVPELMSGVQKVNFPDWPLMMFVDFVSIATRGGKQSERARKIKVYSAIQTKEKFVQDSS
jgi:hypothetical protein